MKALLWLFVLVVLTSCGKSQGPLEKIAAKASAPTGTRAIITQDIVSAVQKRSFSIGDAIDLAATRLEAAGGGSAGASTDQGASLAATAFAGGVLDAVEQMAGTLPQGGEFEIFWMKVGRLAFKSGEEAVVNQRLEEARSLVLAGGKRWQNEPYWLRYTDHDGLVSAIMAAQGNRSEAIQRLQSRPDLSGVALEVYQSLTNGGR